MLQQVVAQVRVINGRATETVDTNDNHLGLDRLGNPLSVAK
jgi:hypothetical protein